MQGFIALRRQKRYSRCTCFFGCSVPLFSFRNHFEFSRTRTLGVFLDFEYGNLAFILVFVKFVFVSSILFHLYLLCLLISIPLLVLPHSSRLQSLSLLLHAPQLVSLQSSSFLIVFLWKERKNSYGSWWPLSIRHSISTWGAHAWLLWFLAKQKVSEQASQQRIDYHSLVSFSPTVTLYYIITVQLTSI